MQIPQFSKYFTFENEKRLLFLLLLVTLISRIFLIFYIPLVKDEIIYAENIHQQIEHPSLELYLLDQQVTWKPPVFFLVYAPMVNLLQHLPIPFEVAYRLPTILFSLISIVALYFVIKNIASDISISFFTSLIYSLIFLTVYVNSVLLIDTLNLMFILIALYFYTSKMPDWKYLIGGLFTILAFYTKLWIAGLVPILALIWLYQNHSKSIFNKYFICSLLLLPLAGFFYWFWAPTSQDATPIQIIFDRILMMDLSIIQLFGSVFPFFLCVNLWIGFGLFGMLKFWKGNLFMFVWALLSILPILAAYFMPWYALPLMVPLAYFSALVLIKMDGKMLVDVFFIIILILLILSGYILGFFLWEQRLFDAYIAEKEAGNILAFKENVTIVGDWAPSVAGYKFLQERRELGYYYDFGWMVMEGHNFSLSEIADNYNVAYAGFSNDFMCLYMNTSKLGCDYKKPSNITKADYIAVIGYENQTLNDFTLIYNNSNIRIFSRFGSGATD